MNARHTVPTSLLFDNRLRYTCRMFAGRCHRVATSPFDVPSNNDCPHTSLIGLPSINESWKRNKSRIGKKQTHTGDSFDFM